MRTDGKGRAGVLGLAVGVDQLRRHQPDRRVGLKDADEPGQRALRRHRVRVERNEHVRCASLQRLVHGSGVPDILRVADDRYAVM